MIHPLRTWLAQLWTHNRLGCALFCAVAALLLSGPIAAQTTSAISGTVKDTSEALVPDAKVSLINESNKGTRVTTSNGEGFFHFTAVPPAVYSILITRQGFETWKVTGIDVHPGDSLTVPKIHMVIGTVVESVVVTAEVAGVTLTSGEHSTMITAEDIGRLSTTGRDAAELVSMLPGFTLNAGTGLNNTGADYTTMGFGSGNVGAYGANGSAPQSGLVNVSADGANVIDPGDMGGQVSNINMDQVQEVKVQTSNFGADEAKGPIVINAVGKSGSDVYHGGLYTYFRNAALNSNDWISNYYGTARATSKYYYPGGTLGGPIQIPGTKFNHNKHLIFWAGFEYYGQQNSAGLVTAFIPPSGTATKFNTSYNMLGGDLSSASIANALNITPAAQASGCAADYSIGSTFTNVQPICTAVPSGAFDVNGNAVSNGYIGSGTGGTNSIDPAMAVYTSMYPAINRIPQPIVTNGATQYATDGINYVHNAMATHNGYQLHSRVDENFSDNLKLYGTYNLEKVNDQAPIDNNYDNALGTLPFSTPFDSNTDAQYLTLNLTKTIGSTMTNELIGSGVYFNEPGQFANRSLAQAGGAWASKGYNGGESKNGTTQLPIINSWGDAGGDVTTPSFEMAYVPAGSRYLHKFSWNISDNLTKQLRTHSIKVGIYGEETGNNQLALGSTYNGSIDFMEWDTCPLNSSTIAGKLQTSVLENQVANFLQGCALNYSQDNMVPGANLRFHTLEGYATDEWKVNSKLTLTLGVRLSHLTPWTDAHGVGLAVWKPSELTKGVLLNTLTTSNTTWTGFDWHAKNSSVPVAGVPTRALFVLPRFGLAYDMYGNGKTTFRGGWGAYRSHDSYNNAAGALSTSSGLQTYTISGTYGCSLGQLFNNTKNSSSTSAILPCGSFNGANTTAPFSVSALDPNDDETPITYNYNFTLDQQGPKGSIFEIAYVGNQSNHLSTQGNLQNQNVIPLGAYFAPDPVTGQTNPTSDIPTPSDYRPYPNYTTIDVPNHSLWSNYNALQASWNKQRGSLVWGANYTWSKALAVRGNYDTGYIADPVDPHHDYGIVSYDRPQVFNLTYAYQEGNKFHGNAILSQALNGWELSGITSLQSGPDLSVLNGTTSFGMHGGVGYTYATSATTTTTTTVPVSASQWLGSSDYILQPTVTCDPRRGLKKDQFVNGNCFGIPGQGFQGAWNLPDVHGPAYFKSDLSVYKDFKINDRQNMQFRLSGFNFLNHPITSFNNNNLSTLALNVGDTATNYTTLAQALANVSILNASSFGSTQFKYGVRIVELGFKYNF